MSTERLDLLIARAPYFIFAGFAVGLLLARFLGIGSITAIVLIGFGASLACMRDYRTEKGLWMLALLFGTISILAYICFESAAIAGLHQAQNFHWTDVLDICLATFIAGLQSRVLWKAFQYNREFSRR